MKIIAPPALYGITLLLPGSQASLYVAGQSNDTSGFRRKEGLRGMSKRAHRRFGFPAAAGFVLIALALSPATVRAQTKSDRTQSAAMNTTIPEADTTGASFGQANEQSALELITLVLKLNDSQQEQVHAAFDAAVKVAAPILDQMEHNKDALFAAVRSGKSEEEIKRLADEQGQLTSRMLLLQAQTFAKLWALLDSRQKGLADDFVDSNIRLFLPADPQ